MNLYIKIENGEPVGHPLMESNLLEVYEVDLIDDAFLEKHSLARFQREELTQAQVLLGESGYAKGSDGIVRPVYEAREMTQEEKVDAWVRQPRNMYLARSDWTQMPDAPLSAEKKAEWAEYRQALRDMTETYANIQNPSEIVPPSMPSQ